MLWWLTNHTTLFLNTKCWNMALLFTIITSQSWIWKWTRVRVFFNTLISIMMASTIKTNDLFFIDLSSFLWVFLRLLVKRSLIILLLIFLNLRIFLLFTFYLKSTHFFKNRLFLYNLWESLSFIISSFFRITSNWDRYFLLKLISLYFVLYIIVFFIIFYCNWRWFISTYLRKTIFRIDFLRFEGMILFLYL